MIAWMVFLLACGPKHVETGLASWYGPGFAGRPTASGVVFRPWKKSAAHKTLPLGTVVRVTHLENGRSVRLVVNDRGPYVEGRIIDLSRRGARKLRMIDDGVARVEVKVVGCRKKYKACH